MRFWKRTRKRRGSNDHRGAVSERTDRNQEQERTESRFSSIQGSSRPPRESYWRSYCKHSSNRSIAEFVEVLHHRSGIFRYVFPLDGEIQDALQTFQLSIYRCCFNRWIW